MSRERNIVNQVVSNLAAIDGSGYTFDISGSDQIIVGDQFNPIRVPCAYVFVSLVWLTQTDRF